jgi:hypothetical protein
VTFTGFNGGKILAHCNNDYDEVVDLSKTDISGFDLNTVGEQTVTVSYGGKETAFTAWVTEKQVVSTVLTPPTKTSYIEKNMADLAGAKVTVNYDNGTEETITVDPSDEDFEVYFLNGGDITAPLTAGTKTLVVTFKGAEAKLTDGSRVTFDVLEVFPYSKEWVKGKWYNQNGTCTYKYTGSWKKNKKGWWFEDTSGWYPKNQWQKIDGKWYYFKADGFMAAGEWVKGYWLNDNGTWTYKPKGSWKQNAKGWWYETTTGWYPKNMWQKIDGKWYYFNARGYMVTNTTVDGYRIGANGVANR